MFLCLDSNSREQIVTDICSFLAQIVDRNSPLFVTTEELRRWVLFTPLGLLLARPVVSPEPGDLARALNAEAQIPFAEDGVARAYPVPDIRLVSMSRDELLRAWSRATLSEFNTRSFRYVTHAELQRWRRAMYTGALGLLNSPAQDDAERLTRAAAAVNAARR